LYRAATLRASASPGRCSNKPASAGVEIVAEDDTLVIRPARKPRASWAAAFQEMARRGDDVLLDDVPPSLSAWDEDEWEWQ